MSAPAPPPLDIVALDDDPDFLEYLADALSRQGHTVRACRTPEAFFHACQERLPDIALLDIKMGAVSGEEVLQRIRQRWPRLCVIVVTGYPSLETMRRTFKAEAFDYIEKPFSMEHLKQTLAQAAETHKLGRSSQDRLRAGLGRQLRVARTARGWTLKELSDASGVSVSQLSSIERGAHLPSLESLLAIAEALGENPSDWLRDSGF
ncbi:MAG: response regulator [Planctomycetota bacterium]|nr:MAG: response regulator [Planctomycetota bacterium]